MEQSRKKIMASKNLDDFFNLPTINDVTVEDPVKTRDEIIKEATSIYTALSTAEKIDFALPTVVGLDAHDIDMDNIAARAVKTFEDLVALGGNVPDMHAGKIYEVAGQMLKTALDAKNAKADKKLKMIELQLKKVRAEQIDFDLGTGTAPGTNTEFDRNELLRHIVSSGKKEISDK